MTKPLTKRDWQVINAALALLEAGDADELDGFSHEDVDQTRAKVHARLSRYRNPYEEENT